MKQRELLEEEQAWLRQKLTEQEKLLALKQAQLTETELLYLQTGDPNCNAPSVNMYPYSPHGRLGVEPPPVQRQPYGLYPMAEGGVVSTNFPPEEFDEFGQPKLLTESMHGLGLGYESSRHSHHEWSPSSGNSDSRHKRKPHDGRKSSRRKESYGESNHRVPSRNHGQYDGYASMYSASKSKRKHAGSISSSPSTTSTSTMSSNPRHRSKVKHTATSPLYRDASTAVSPRPTLSPVVSPHPALSPAKVEVTRAPAHTSFNRSSSSSMAHKHPSRLQGNRSLQSNRQRTSPSTTTHNRDTLQLTDLIDSLDDTIELQRTSFSHHKLINRTHNGSSRGHPRTRSPDYGITPELFSMEDGSDDQESRMLEEVFFVV
ncbi:uncharacterized protein [Amphiura filiformis]|uniref:uncharacterized protein n=1 Tax=Amphiura filiformis TaxID=82378 RepID=UPI003B2284BD